MSTKTSYRNRRSRRKGGGSRPFSPSRRPERPKPPCKICGEPIKDITSALSYNGVPVHFDCALAEVSEKLNPGKYEKVIYLGKGSFGAVELEAYRQRVLKISRSMVWENQEETAEWRQQLVMTDIQKRRTGQYPRNKSKK